MNGILTKDEIDRLTYPLTQGAAQARRLSQMLRCPIQRRPDGLPVVTHKMLDRLEGEDREMAQNDAGIIWSQQA